MPFRNNRWLLLGFVLLFFPACPKVTKVVAPPPAPPKPPALEKTFGEITYVGLATLVIRYKDIVLLVDPVFDPVGLLGKTSAKLDTLYTPGEIRRTKPASLSMEQLPPIDYLLLTDAQPHHLGELARKNLRKDLKIIATDEAVQMLRKEGFTQSKGLAHVSRLMLKKGEAFLFVGVVQSRNPASGDQVNSYLLEFDNGRNIFISGDMVDEAVLREFVYGLRDDGKQVDMAFVYGGGFRTINEKIFQSADENMSAMMIGLIQPKVGLVLQADGLDVRSFDESLFFTRLQEQIFSGDAIVPKPSEIFPF